jgi:hypothetical protein
VSPTADDLRTVGELTPEALRRYLVSGGWAPAQQLERATLWTRHEDDGDFQILLPGDRTLRDYASRVYDLLATVSAVESRPVPLILYDLQTTDADTVDFRLLPSGPTGTIPLVNAVDALAGVRELMVASTYATMNDHPMLVQGRRPDQVHEFARTVRLGTPRPGSWSIAAHIPVPEHASGTDTPAARQISLQVHRAVRACYTASSEALGGFDLGFFLRRTGEGVSANVCEALTKLGRDGVPYDIRFGWAQQLSTTAGPRLFRFTTGRIEALKTAAEQLKIAVPDGQITVVGVVSRLRRDPGEGGGQATVRGPIATVYGTSERAVRVMLPADLYALAVDAHGRQHQVRVTGTAFRGRVDGVQRFEVIEEAP